MAQAPTVLITNARNIFQEALKIVLNMLNIALFVNLYFNVKNAKSNSKTRNISSSTTQKNNVIILLHQVKKK